MKIILLTLILMLSGCFEKSGFITTTCTKEEVANSLSSKTIYEIEFKKDIISNVTVTYEYNDTNTKTIDSIKKTIDSNDKFIEGLNKNVITEDFNNYKISYTIDSSSSSLIKDKYNIKEKRSELVTLLKNDGYTCK